MANFHLSIVTPEDTVFDEEVASLIVPGAKGYLGVLANHAPLISPLQPGKITIRLTGDTELYLAIAGGFLEVANNQATILADAAETIDKLDRERALKSLERAKERLHDTTGDWDTTRATAAFERAKNRVRLIDTTLVTGT